MRIGHRTPSAIGRELLPPDQDDLALEVDPEPLEHLVMRDCDELEHIRGGRVIDVHDEVGVFRRDLRPTETAALEPGRLHEPSRLVVRGVLEDAAQASDSVRLRGLALGLDRVGAGANRRCFLAMDAQPGAHDDVVAEVVLETRVAIRETALRGAERQRAAGRIERGAVDENIGHLGTEGTRIAEHARAARAGHADAELEPRDAARSAVQRHARHHAAPAQLDGGVVEHSERPVVVTDHQAVDAAVADERVAPCSQHGHGDAGVRGSAPATGRARPHRAWW